MKLNTLIIDDSFHIANSMLKLFNFSCPIRISCILHVNTFEHKLHDLLIYENLKEIFFYK